MSLTLQKINLFDPKLPTFTQLRRYVAGGAHHGEGLALGGQDLGDAEVPDLDVVQGPRQEDVLGLEVAVEDLVLVDVVHGEHDLKTQDQ